MKEVGKRRDELKALGLTIDKASVDVIRRLLDEAAGQEGRALLEGLAGTLSLDDEECSDPAYAAIGDVVRAGLQHGDDGIWSVFGRATAVAPDDRTIVYDPVERCNVDSWLGAAASVQRVLESLRHDLDLLAQSEDVTKGGTVCRP